MIRMHNLPENIKNALSLTGDRKAEEAKSAHIILDSLKNPKADYIQKIHS